MPSYSAYAKLEAADPKNEPSLQALSVLRLVDLVCHFWQQYVNTALLSLAGSSVTIRREMVIFNNQSVSKIEGAANALLNRLTDCKRSFHSLQKYMANGLASAVNTWLSLCLSKQKKNEFKPRSDELSFGNTEPCDACCAALAKVRDAARQNLSGKNLDVFLTEVGVSFNT